MICKGRLSITSAYLSTPNHLIFNVQDTYETWADGRCFQWVFLAKCRYILTE